MENISVIEIVACNIIALGIIFILALLSEIQK
jgi:hypothetical protein